MTLLKYPLTGTSGTAITAANSSLQLISASGTATAQYQSGAAFQGTTGGRFISDGTNAAYGQAQLASCTQAAFSVAFKIPASVPAADYTFATIYDTTSTRILQLTYRTTGAVVTNDKSNAQITVLSAAQATAGTFFRFETVITALSATTGAFTVRAYNSSSVQVGSTASSSTANLGTTNMQYYRVGATSSAVFTADIDSIQTNDGGTSEIGALSANTTPPTVVVGANQSAAASSTAPLSCTGTAYNGDTIASYAWTIIEYPTGGSASLSSSTAQNPTLTTGSVPGRYLIGVTVTDTSGNTSTQAIEKVFVRQSNIVVAAVTSNSGWGTAVPANTNDSSDSTYDESGASGSTTVLTLRLQPLTPSPSTFSLIIRDYLTAAGGTQSVALLEGATVRKNWGALPTPPVGSANVADHTALTLSGAEIATVGSWDELDLQLTSQ